MNRVWENRGKGGQKGCLCLVLSAFQTLFSCVPAEGLSLMCTGGWSTRDGRDIMGQRIHTPVCQDGSIQREGVWVDVLGSNQ